MARLTLFFATLFCLLLILSPLLDVVAQVDDSSNQSDYSSPTTVILIVLISLFFAAGFVSIYLKHYATCLGFHQLNARVDGGPRRRRDPTPGIDPALIASFPIFLFSQVKLHRIGNAPLECAVCLNEFSEDHERLRLLPGCSHVFHPDCIDPWLANHITCPICRATLPQHQSSVTLFDHPPDDLELWIDHPLTSPPLSHDNNSNNGEGHVIIPVIRPSPDVQANIINMINSPTTMLDKGKGDHLRKLTRSHSTGHSLREEGDRFTLRLPQELLRNKLELGAPYADDNNINFNKGEALPTALISPRVGYRARSVGCTGMTIKPECWRFSVSPPFIISQRGAGTGLTRSPGSKSDQDGPTDMMQECGSTTSDLSGVTSPKRLGLFKSIKSPLKREAAPSDDIGEHS